MAGEAVGFSLVIDEALIKRMEKAQEKIDGIAKKSEEAEQRVVASFKKMGDLGVDYFINKLNEAQNRINALSGSNININATGLENISSQAARGADDVNELYKVISKLAEANAILAGNIGSSTTSLKGFFSAFRGASNDVDKLVKAEETLIKQNEILSRMQAATLNKKMQDVDYQKGINQAKELAAIETARKNQIAEMGLQESNAHKQKMSMLQAETKEIQAQTIVQKDAANQKINAANALTVATMQETNAIKESINAERQNARNISLANKQAAADMRVQSEQIKTQMMEQIKAEKEKQAELKRTIAEVNRLAKAYKAMPTIMTGTGLNKLLTESFNASSINQRIVAIQNLKNSIRDLDTTDVNYKNNLKNINDEISRLTKELRQLGVSTNEAAKSHRNLMDISGQLARKLALVFSVSQISGYMNKLVAVRGEFELQQKSLQVLLQNSDAANKLWQQTVDLAVRSPFRVGELVAYTRQLAAYRIETDKLHETTRKLADVSAGLGVDMNRLILAYGQVRAAEYLRGTELRQFTEAGIPMLDELAKRFTELEGRAVSAGDVFERISKRMVSFEDVTAVFDKMTSAGGAFYKMQEEQSTTLKGMISNLHDSIDLMLNDIGKTNEGVLKTSVNMAKYVVDHWEGIVTILKVVLPLLTLYRVSLMTTSEKMAKFVANTELANASLTKQVSLLQIGRAAWIRFANSIKNAGAIMKANLPAIAITAAIAAVWELYSAWKDHNEQLEEISKRYSKLSKQLDEITYNFRNAVNANDIADQRKKLQSLVDLAKGEYHMSIQVDVYGLDEKALSDKFNNLRQQMMEAQAFAAEFELRMQKATHWKLEDDIYEDLQQLGQESDDLQNKLITNLSTLIVQLGDNYDKLTDKQKEAYNILREPVRDGESDAEYLNRLRKGYSLIIAEYNSYKEALSKTTDPARASQLNIEISKIQSQIKSLGIELNKIDGFMSNFSKYENEAKAEFDAFVRANQDYVKQMMNLPESQRTIALKMAIDKLAAEKEWNDFAVDYIKRWTEETFYIKFAPTEAPKETLKAWQETYKELFKGYEGYQKITKAATTQKQIIDRINASLSEQKDLVERIKKAGTGKGAAYEGMSLAEEEKKLKQLKEMLDWLGGSNKDKGTKQGKDWFSELAKNIKDAHKEFVSLNKDLDKATSYSVAMERFRGVFEETLSAVKEKGISIDLGSIDFTTEQGTIDALELLKNKLPDSAKEARLNIEKALSDIKGEITITMKKDADKELKRQVEDMFDKYSLSLELDKLNIPTGLAKSLFDIEAVDLGGLKKKLEELKPQFVGTEMEEQYHQYLEKVSDMEDKARIENLKKYTQYLIAAQSEAVKIKLEEVRKIAEIEKLKMTPAQKEIAKTAVRQETQKKLDINAWNQFKESDTYIEMFDNLENVSNRALEAMRNKLIEMRKELKNLDPKDLKEIQARFNEIEEALVKKDPFKNLTSNFKKAINAMKGYEKAQDKVYKAEIDVSNQQETVDNLTMQVEEQKKLVAENGANAEIDKYNLELLEDKLKLATLLLEKSKAELDNAVQEKEAQKQILSISKERLKESANSLSEGYNAFTGLTDTIQESFGEFSSDTQDFLENIGAVIGGVIEVENGLSEILDGKAITGTLHIATGVLKSIGGIFGFGTKDKKKERQIQREIKFVEDLQRAYEKLGKAIDDAYSIDTLQAATEGAKDNINAQIASYQKMIAAEQDKKKTDDDRIKEWQNAIEDLQEQLKELNEQAFSQVTGGIIDSVLDAATQFTDSWLNSFNEVGDGLSGLEDNFKESMQSMLKQQASMLITQAYVSKWKSELEKYINPEKEDLQLTVDEAKSWVQSVTSTLPQLNDALTNYFEAFKQAGIDLGESESKLSGLRSGIQGITESQADILAAYMNSVRFYVAEQNTYLQQIANSLVATDVENPMVTQLKIIASQTSAINTLLNSLTTPYRNGGRGLKVVM